jgi:hypothetical protein
MSTSEPNPPSTSLELVTPETGFTTGDAEPLLKEFLSRNPEALLIQEGKDVKIRNPWGDSSVRIALDRNHPELFDALNKVYFPPRLTAIWHADTNDLEIIWTPVRPPIEFENRSFIFHFEQQKYKCEFSGASPRLLEIADNFQPSGAATSTSYRNLQSFKQFKEFFKVTPSALGDMLKPTSFWIRGFIWDDGAAIRLARHLNFFMYYFDRETPRILIHAGQSVDDKAVQNLRFPFDQFPPEIRSTTLEPTLLSLWDSAVDAPDPFRRFLYLYQIIEYGAFYHIEKDSLQQIKKIITGPNCLSKSEEAARQIIETLSQGKVTDAEKISAIISQSVDPKALWKEIEPFMEYFSNVIEFEGGFTLPALLKPGWKCEDFIHAWTPKFPESLRKIRNALVHSREARMLDVISPTRGNYEKLRPWLPLLSVAAMQIIIYRDCN